LLSKVVSTSLQGEVLDISQFVNPVCQHLLDDIALWYQSLDTIEQEKPTSQDNCETASLDKTVSCTVMYPAITSLSSLISHEHKGSYHEEQTVLNLIGQSNSCNNVYYIISHLCAGGGLLCVLGVYPMLRDSSVPSLSDLCMLGKDNCATSLDECAIEHSPAGKAPVEGVIIGVIRIADVHLSWLHPSRVYICVSIKHGGRGSLQNMNLWLAANNCAMVRAIYIYLNVLVCVPQGGKD